MTAIRIPLRLAGQEGNVIRVSRITSREGSITKAHKARKTAQQSSANETILTGERLSLFANRIIASRRIAGMDFDV
jgi:hypothetical protein